MKVSLMDVYTLHLPPPKELYLFYRTYLIESTLKTTWVFQKNKRE